MGVDTAILNRHHARPADPGWRDAGRRPGGQQGHVGDRQPDGSAPGGLPRDSGVGVRRTRSTEWATTQAAIPVDKPDADVVYTINPREAKYDPRTITNAALIFYAADENWTMPSGGWDQTNFGLFSGDDALGRRWAHRVYEKVKELRGKRLVISECGHGYRSTRCEGPNWAGVDVGLPHGELGLHHDPLHQGRSDQGGQVARTPSRSPSTTRATTPAAADSTKSLASS